MESLELYEYDEATQKTKELEQIQKDLECINQLYKDLGEFVVNQEDDLKAVEVKQEVIIADTKETVETLKKASVLHTKSWTRALQISLGAIGSAVGIVAGPVGSAIGGTIGLVSGKIIGKKVEKSHKSDINNM
jgi:phage tail tape-measure protein